MCLLLHNIRNLVVTIRFIAATSRFFCSQWFRTQGSWLDRWKCGRVTLWLIWDSLLFFVGKNCNGLRACQVGPLIWRIGVILLMLHENRMGRVVGQRWRAAQVIYVLLNLVCPWHVLPVSLVGLKMLIKIFLFDQSFWLLKFLNHFLVFSGYPLLFQLSWGVI